MLSKKFSTISNSPLLLLHALLLQFSFNQSSVQVSAVDCSTLKNCEACYDSSYWCHWCAPADANEEQAPGSRGGKGEGMRALKDRDSSEMKGSCSSIGSSGCVLGLSCVTDTSCAGDCTSTSSLCHWCGDDKGCHLIGSPYGCSVGVGMNSLDVECVQNKYTDKMSMMFVVSVICFALGLSACISAIVINLWSWRYIRANGGLAQNGNNLGEGLLMEQRENLVQMAPAGHQRWLQQMAPAAHQQSGDLSENNFQGQGVRLARTQQQRSARNVVVPSAEAEAEAEVEENDDNEREMHPLEEEQAVEQQNENDVVE